MGNSSKIDLKLIVDDQGSKSIMNFAKAGDKQIKTLSATIDRKLGGAFRKVGRIAGGALKGITSQLFSLKGAIAAAGIGVLAKGFLDAASSTEQYKIRLTALLGSVEEGNRLFKEMSDYASRTPFEYEQIMGSATQLAGVLKGGVNEIKQWIPLIGDLAAVSSLSIQATTEQVSRMLSAGAASADMFRERGILAMIGFKAGVSYTAEETRKILMESWEKTDSQFKRATEKLSKSWSGLMSMFSDAWFQFQNLVMDAGVFDYIKTAAKSALDKIKDIDMKTWAGEAADAAISMFNKMILGAGKFADFVAETMPKVKSEFNTLKNAFDSLPSWMKSMGIAGAMVFGRKGAVGFLAGLHLIETAKNTIKGAAAVGRGDLSFMEYATSNFDELKARLDKIGSTSPKGATIFRAAIPPKGSFSEKAQNAVDALKKVAGAAKDAQKKVDATTNSAGVFFDYIAAAEGRDPFVVTPKIKKSPAQPWASGIAEMKADLAGLGGTIESIFDVSSVNNLIEGMKGTVSNMMSYSGWSRMTGNIGQQFRAAHTQYSELYQLQKKILEMGISDIKRSQTAPQISLNIEVAPGSPAASDPKELARQIKRELEALNTRGVN